MQAWFDSIDAGIAEDTLACRRLYAAAAERGDKYALQLIALGYDFEAGTAPPFAATLAAVAAQTLFNPVRMYDLGGPIIHVDAIPDEVMAPPPHIATEVTILNPLRFVGTLADYGFPIGGPTRGGTNQVLAAHDLAHLASFAANRAYSQAVYDYCLWLATTAQTDERVRIALLSFDSMLSMRLYYLVEVLVVVVDRARLERLLMPLRIDGTSTADVARACLDAPPLVLVCVLDALHTAFHALVEPLGGESRDVLNRHRKHARTRYGATASKFAGNSLYSLRERSKDALMFVRSDNEQIYAAVTRKHAPFIAAMLGTARLTLDDWFAHALVPDPESPLVKYVTGLFADDDEEEHLFRRAFASCQT